MLPIQWLSGIRKRYSESCKERQKVHEAVEVISTAYTQKFLCMRTAERYIAEKPLVFLQLYVDHLIR